LTETTGLLDRPTIYYGWNHWPLKIYNPPMVFKDVDLQEVARGSMASWEDGTGLDLFVEVDDPEQADCEIVYFPDLSTPHNVKTISLNPDKTFLKKELRIYLLNTLSPMDLIGHKVFSHELGHVMGLKHSLDTGHLMIGMTAPRVSDPTLDETRLMKVMYHLPPIWDSHWFVNE
jgi:hypothetical protein